MVLRLLRGLLAAATLLAIGWAIAVAASLSTVLSAGKTPTVDWWNLVPAPDWSAFVLLPSVALLIEAGLVGWQDCALRRVLTDGSASVRTDRAYFLWEFTGAPEALLRLVTLGLFVWLERIGEHDIALLSLRDWPVWLALPVILPVENFFTYWAHRFLHTPAMWPIHRIHHSMEAFAVINGGRQHPVEGLIEAVTQILPLALLGFATEHVALYFALFGPTTMYNHSNWKGGAFLSRLLIVRPLDHRLHHAVASGLHDRNFGPNTTLWDRVFGTYLAPSPGDETVAIGLADKTGVNTANPPREMVVQTWEWLKALRGEPREKRPARAGMVPIATAMLIATTPTWAAETTRLTSGSLAGFAVGAEISRDREDAGIGHWLSEAQTVGVTWRAWGLTASASGGLLSYSGSGVYGRVAQTASFAVGYEIATGPGALRLELRQTALWESETRLDETSARLGWSLRF